MLLTLGPTTHILPISCEINNKNIVYSFNSLCAIVFLGERAPSMRANTRGKKQRKNASTMTTIDKNDDNKRRIKH